MTLFFLASMRGACGVLQQLDQIASEYTDNVQACIAVQIGCDGTTEMLSTALAM